MSKKAAKYWFPAKRYGWGWGLPSAWQGWVVFIIFIGLISTLPFAINPSENTSLFVAAMIVSSVILIGICYAKGEPPKWRWGSSGDDEKENA